MSEGKGYILGHPTLFGHSEVIGFGDESFCVRVMDCVAANDMVKAGHYSGTVAQASFVHLGVYIDGRHVGVLQFGPGLRPASGGNIVSDCKKDEWLELNRMWLDESAPRNSESRALSYALKLLRRRMPALTWIQSWADERAGGKLGVVYQACSALYLGERMTKFVEFEGRAYHEMAWHASYEWMERSFHKKWIAVKRAVEAGEVTPQAFRQFRYFFPVRRSVIKRLKMPVLPYPKPECAVT